MTIKKFNKNIKTTCRKFFSALIENQKEQYFMNGLKIVPLNQNINKMGPIKWKFKVIVM